jgi:hypothetical protein
MAVSVDWATRVIFIPQADLVDLGGGVYELDTNAFRLELKDLEDDAEGQVFPDTHRHSTEVTVGGVTLARSFEIINGYTITFEDGQYAINLVGSNNNIADVTNVNQVSIRSGNTAGLVSTETAEDIANQVWESNLTDHITDQTFGQRIQKLLTTGKYLGLK